MKCSELNVRQVELAHLYYRVNFNFLNFSVFIIFSFFNYNKHVH
jgi:hypothetical protein